MAVPNIVSIITAIFSVYTNTRYQFTCTTQKALHRGHDHRFLVWNLLYVTLMVPTGSWYIFGKLVELWLSPSNQQLN